MRNYQLLITPEEAVQLSEHTLLHYNALDFAKSSEAAFNEIYPDCDPLFLYFCIINAVFEAGRVQGIREERQRRNKRRVSDAV